MPTTMTFRRSPSYSLSRDRAASSLAAASCSAEDRHGTLVDVQREPEPVRRRSVRDPAPKASNSGRSTMESGLSSPHDGQFDGGHQQARLRTEGRVDRVDGRSGLGGHHGQRGGRPAPITEQPDGGTHDRPSGLRRLPLPQWGVVDRPLRRYCGVGGLLSGDMSPRYLRDRSGSAPGDRVTPAGPNRRREGRWGPRWSVRTGRCGLRPRAGSSRHDPDARPTSRASASPGTSRACGGQRQGAVPSLSVTWKQAWGPPVTVTGPEVKMRSCRDHQVARHLDARHLDARRREAAQVDTGRPGVVLVGAQVVRPDPDARHRVDGEGVARRTGMDHDAAVPQQRPGGRSVRRGPRSAGGRRPTRAAAWRGPVCRCARL